MTDIFKNAWKCVEFYNIIAKLNTRKYQPDKLAFFALSFFYLRKQNIQREVIRKRQWA